MFMILEPTKIIVYDTYKYSYIIGGYKETYNLGGHIVGRNGWYNRICCHVGLYNWLHAKYPKLIGEKMKN